MSTLGDDLRGAARAAGLKVGAGAGVSAASTVYGGLQSAGLLAALPSAGLVFVTFPLLLGYLGWKAVDLVTGDGKR